MGTELLGKLVMIDENGNQRELNGVINSVTVEPELMKLFL